MCDTMHAQNKIGEDICTRLTVIVHKPCIDLLSLWPSEVYKADMAPLSIDFRETPDLYRSHNQLVSSHSSKGTPVHTWSAIQDVPVLDVSLSTYDSIPPCSRVSGSQPSFCHAYSISSILILRDLPTSQFNICYNKGL